jgi:hypothetical protein
MRPDVATASARNARASVRPARAAKQNLYICDAGHIGETGLHSAKGSVFLVSADGQLLLPIALNCLAHPSALALAPAAPADSVDGAPGGAAAEGAAPFVYVAEMAANRILRFARQPVDVFHGSVFYQFGGGAGPSALACAHDGSLFVGHFEFAQRGAARAQQGKISKLSPTVRAATRAARAQGRVADAGAAPAACAPRSRIATGPALPRTPHARTRAPDLTLVLLSVLCDVPLRACLRAPVVISVTSVTPPDQRAPRHDSSPMSESGAQGELLEEYFIPAPEVTGLALKGRTLYVTEASTNTLYAIEL